MKRARFIKSSLFGIAVFTVTPQKYFLSDNALQLVKLKVNEHIRHGSYGDEFIENLLPGGTGIRLRVDRFLNPDGDMDLYQINNSGRKTHVAVQGKQILIDNLSGRHKIEPYPEEVDTKFDSNLRLCRVESRSIALGEQQHLLVLTGSIECYSRILGPGSCFFSSGISSLQTSGSTSYLIFSS
ncbi:MAG: hypothetical protein RIC15_07340 [Vicingaceae bacterium]